MKYVICVIIAALAAILTFIPERTERSTVVQKIPVQDIAGWQRTEIPVTDETRRILETNLISMQLYQQDNHRVLLTLVSYCGNMVAFHFPESCYTGQGSRIIHRETGTTGSTPYNEFTLRGNKGNKTVRYYFKTSRHRTSSAITARFFHFLDLLRFEPCSVTLVRLTAETPEDIALFMGVLSTTAPYI